MGRKALKAAREQTRRDKSSQATAQTKAEAAERRRMKKAAAAARPVPMALTAGPDEILGVKSGKGAPTSIRTPYHA